MDHITLTVNVKLDAEADAPDGWSAGAAVPGGLVEAARIEGERNIQSAVTDAAGTASLHVDADTPYLINFTHNIESGGLLADGRFDGSAESATVDLVARFFPH